MRAARLLLLLSTCIVLFGAPLALGQFSDVTVLKSGPEEAAADTDVTYSITVSNFGPDGAADVTLSDPLPAGMTFVSETQVNGPAASCTVPPAGDPGTILCTFATFPAGATADFTIVAHIPAGTPAGTIFTNVATVSVATDPNSENDSSTAVTVTPAAAEADLGIEKSGPAGAGADMDVSYTIQLTNAGPDDAANVQFDDTLPGTMTFVSLVQESGPALSCTMPQPGNGGTVTCTAASFPNGATATFTLVAHIPDGTTSGTEYTNNVVVTSGNDPLEENNLGTTTLTVSSVDVSLAKSGPGTVVAGDELTYTITVTNNGPDAAENVRFEDVLPDGTTFVSLDQNSGPAASCVSPGEGEAGLVGCTIGLMTSGGAATFTLKVRAGNTPSVTNTATAFTDSFDSDPSNDSGSVTTAVTPSADLAVTKSGPATITAGTNITYTVTVVNNGPSDAASVSLTDTLPANTTFVSMTQDDGPAFSCTVTTCTVANFPAGSTASFTLVLAVAPGATGSITNTAAIGSSTGDPVPANDTSTSTATIAASADVAVTKSGPASVAAGTNISYTVTVANNGPSDATAVSLTDTLPANTTFVSRAQDSGPAFTCTDPAVGGTGTITCNAASLAAGSTAAFTFVFAVAPGATGTIANTASVSAGTSDPAAGNNSATATSNVMPSADVSVSKSGPATYTPGTNITYTVTVGSNGPSDATGVVLTDTLPANTTFVSRTQDSGPAFTCTDPAAGTTGTITCNAASLPLGSTASFTFVFAVSPAATGSLANTATVTAGTADPVSANDTATSTATSAPVADLGVAKNGPATVTAGTTISYTVTVTNNGPSDAATVSLADTLPAGTTFVSRTQDSGPAFTCTDPAVGSTGTITCTAAGLPVGTTAAFTFVFQVSPGATGPIANTATVSSSASDPAPDNNSATSTAAVTTSADVSVTKSGPAAATTASDVTYSITVTNGGPSDAANVSMSDATPAGTTFVSSNQDSGPPFNCTGPAAGGTGTVTCTIATLTAGASATFSLTVHVSPTATGSLANTATVTASTPDPAPANNTATAPSILNPGPTDLSITKTANGNRFEPGAPVTYTITVTNNGPSLAAGVTVTDVLPAGATFGSATPSQGTCSGTTTVTCSLGTLDPLATATITLVLTPARTPGPVLNTATVTAVNAETSPANNAATAAIDIAATSDIPSLSPAGMMVLAISLATLAMVVQRRG